MDEFCSKASLIVRIVVLVLAGIVIFWFTTCHAGSWDLHVHTEADDWQRECNQQSIDRDNYDRGCSKGESERSEREQRSIERYEVDNTR